MVKRILVPKGRQKRESDNHHSIWLFVSFLSFLVVIVRWLFDIIKHGVQLPYYVKSEHILTSAAIIMGQVFLRQKQVSDHFSAICIYPIGIQLCTVQKVDKQDGCVDNLHVVKFGTFIPLDLIIDCVITEVILVSKVVNCVILRLKHSIHEYEQIQLKEPSSLNDRIQLVDICPGSNMSYVQCLHIRREIMSHINEIKIGKF
jgi:hypothetical protein